MVFVILNMVHPNTRSGWSDAKNNLETIELYQFKNDMSRENLKVEEKMNEISIADETYS